MTHPRPPPVPPPVLQIITQTELGMKGWDEQPLTYKSLSPPDLEQGTGSAPANKVPVQDMGPPRIPPPKRQTAEAAPPPPHQTDNIDINLDSMQTGATDLDYSDQTENYQINTYVFLCLSDLLWTSYGLLMDLLWTPYGPLMDLLWTSYG